MHYCPKFCYSSKNPRSHSDKYPRNQIKFMKEQSNKTIYVISNNKVEIKVNKHIYKIIIISPKYLKNPNISLKKTVLL